MRRWLSVVVGAALIVTAVWITTASPAEAATCTGSSISGSGSVVVPSGATCTLNGVTINGSITVQSGGSLELNNSIVRGTVTANQANKVHVVNSYLMGLSINGSAPGTSENFMVCNNTIAGPVNVTSIGASVGNILIGGHQACLPNIICGPFSARYNAAPLFIGGNTVTGGGSVVYNSQLMAFAGNTFGGLISAVGNSPNNGGANVSNDAGARSATCGEPTPSSVATSSSTSSSTSTSTSSSSTTVTTSGPIF